MKFLIAGLGSVGRRHLRNLQLLGQTDILLYRTFQSSLPQEDLMGFETFTDLDRALALKPEAVIVANPTALHLDVAIPAAEAGCHLLIEKPVSHSMQRIAELERAVLRGGARVVVGYQFRFHPGLQLVKRILETGEIGRPLSFRSVYGEYLPGMHPWEDYRGSYTSRADLGGGAILTLCHPLDYLRWQMGEVEAVWSFKGALNDFDLLVEDTAEIGLRFSQGVIGSLHLDFNRRPPAHTLEIIGTAGTLRWDNQDGVVDLFRPDQGWQRYPAPEDFERNSMFLAEMSHFISVVQGETSPAVSLLDGIRAQEIALAAHHSAEQQSLVSIIPEASAERHVSK